MIIGVVAHPLARCLELDNPATNGLSISNDTFPDSYGRYLSNDALLRTGTLFVAEQSTFESRPRGCAMTPMTTVLL